MKRILRPLFLIGFALFFAIQAPRPLAGQGLVLVRGGSVDLQPGQQHAFRLSRVMCCTYLEPVREAFMRYVVEPTGFSEIDPESGLLRVNPDAPHGTTLRVRAEVAGQPVLAEASITVYDPDKVPHVGLWGESARLTCVSREGVVPRDTRYIQEMHLRANGTFRLTWIAFETYWDYWGEYTSDDASRSFTFKVTGGNRKPSTLEFSGEMWVEENGSLVISGPWLGDGIEDPGSHEVCGHVFMR